MSDIADLPCLGAGLGYRSEIGKDIERHADHIDFIEIIADNYMHRRHDELARLREAFTIIPHGLNLSIGRAGGLDPDYLRAVKRVSDMTGAPYYSDHLALTSVPGFEIGHLSPIWYTEAGLNTVIANVRQVQDLLEKPLVLENITYDVEIPGATISQPDFFRHLTEETGCGILFDVTNLYINSVNHRFDALAFLDAFPVESIVQTHLAGGLWSEGYLIDAHCGPVHDEAWALFETLARRIPLKAAIIERDEQWGSFDALLGEVAQARAIMAPAS